MSGFLDPVSQVPHKVEEEVTIRHTDDLENQRKITKLAVYMLFKYVYKSDVSQKAQRSTFTSSVTLNLGLFLSRVKHSVVSDYVVMVLVACRWTGVHLVSDLYKQTEAFGRFEQETSGDVVAEIFGLGARLHFKHLQNKQETFYML